MKLSTMHSMKSRRSRAGAGRSRRRGRGRGCGRSGGRGDRLDGVPHLVVVAVPARPHLGLSTRGNDAVRHV